MGGGAARVIEAAAWRRDPAVWSGRVEGEALGTAATLLFYASEVDGDGVPEHVHAYDELFLVREGRLRFAVGGEAVEAGAGDVVLGPAGLPHAFERIGPGRAEAVNLHLARCFAWAEPGSVTPAPGAAARVARRAEWEQAPGRWSGRVEGRSLGTAATVLFFTADGPGEGPPLHVHDYDEVFVIRRGRAAFTVGDMRLEAGAGDVVFGPAGVPHKFESLGPFETTDLHLADRFEQTNLE